MDVENEAQDTQHVLDFYSGASLAQNSARGGYGSLGKIDKIGENDGR